MHKFLKNLSCLLCLTLIIAGCRKQAFDDYYGRPETLQPPIYQVLQARGNFTTLLAVIDKSGYKETLNAAGYWTFFAPNDAAFKKYFADNSLTLETLKPEDARKLVTYSLVFNAFQTDHLADYQSSRGWVLSSAFKRRTAYYDGFYTGAGPDGASTVLLSSNRNALGNGTSFLFGDNNNKYIPYFYSTFMAAKSLTASDYNYFFPSSTYSGFNVANASVVTKDILAENGVIHEIDQVVAPLNNLEQQLSSNSQYSVFKSLYDRFMVTYSVNTDATGRYNTLNPTSSNKVYIKQYSNLLAFAPGNENYLKLEDNDGQQNGYTMFAPNNTALNQYLTDVILEFYQTIDKLPPNVVADLINAHTWQATVWPSKFASTTNFLGEPARFSPTADVIEKKFCSNGVFYGTNQVQKANVFSSVYARSYLDPAYSLMTRLYDLGLKPIISNPGVRFTVFMLPDAVLKAAGFDYNTNSSLFTYTTGGTTTSGNIPRDMLLRILQDNIVQTPANELNDLSGDGIAEAYSGDYLRWHANTVSSSFTVENNFILSVTGSRTYNNGKVYYLSTNGILAYSVATLASQIAKNATTATSPYYDFYQYLLNSTAYNTLTGEIAAVQLGGSYTVFIPNKAGMQKAVVDGFLPGTTTVVAGVKTFATFTVNPTSATDKDLVARFINFHILNGVTIAPDGKKGINGVGFPTLLKNAAGDVLNVITFNQPGNLILQDNQARQMTLVPPNNASYFPATSNYLGTRTLFHQIKDDYLRYNF
jgi:uncharacterized surface protein with fasciclin (FAS1) repeats